MSKLAPVVVFGYNRKKQLCNLLESLEKNRNIENTDLFIFVDVPEEKKRDGIKKSREVCEFAKEYKSKSKFKNVYLTIADNHKGLAKSIITGVNRVIREYEKVIVLEDDLLVSNDFLEYMQEGLEYYKDKKKVWSITGNTEYLPHLSRYKYDVYASYRGNSLGWGTWLNRWESVDWDVKGYKLFRFNPIERLLFNRGGTDLSKSLDAQMLYGTLDSWAIRWCYQQFKYKKITIYPKYNRIVLQDDNRGVHGSYHSTMKLQNITKKIYFKEVEINKILAKELKLVYAPSYQDTILSKLGIK